MREGGVACASEKVGGVWMVAVLLLVCVCVCVLLLCWRFIAFVGIRT